MDLSAVSGLTTAQRAMLKKANILSASDVLLLSIAELVKKCKMTPADADAIRDRVCKAYRKPTSLLEEVAHHGQETFTTGDARLDQVLGGGYTTGMLWELTGEREDTICSAGFTFCSTTPGVARLMCLSLLSNDFFQITNEQDSPNTRRESWPVVRALWPLRHPHLDNTHLARAYPCIIRDISRFSQTTIDRGSEARETSGYRCSNGTLPF
ncbi:hypothetical protein NEOLEDRAFT_859860 [Neolentinus lepideus HHB14362 ss-1]|uniref:Uncharacterized protein n=1 Tax=Neolentinus lepideus HHB14362 ss-1 TaxID=1314782 RepID=A0A165URQ9_9AGAM|nr:hypothetical protein NEOLEDRAFT_859860 [Neolentinus lepideus HHB14362 ss-1]